MALIEEMKNQGNVLFKYRGTLPLIIFIVGVLVFIQHRLTPGEYPLGSWYDYLCLLVGIFGLLIRIYTVGHSARKTSGRNTQGQVAGEVNKTGIYSTVRHPLYVGNFFMWLGVAMLTGHIWFVVAFIFMYWIYYERIMFAEEAFLREKFGAEYTEWAAITPAFIPSFKNFKKPVYPFNFKKVVRKEKNGILALFFIFFFFNILGNSIHSERLVFENDFWAIAAGVCLVYYLIIKFMTKKTSLLNNY